MPGDAAYVSVEEIDKVLHGIASKIRWSSPSVRNSKVSMSSRNRSDLEDLYRRFPAREAKWFTRLILKNYRPLVFNNNLVYRLCDSVLPCILKVQDDFTFAVAFLQGARTRLLPNSAASRPAAEHILASLKPCLGIKVGRQQWFKARSIKHCIDLGRGRMMVQDKVDGEYCQIHVDATKRIDGIQIFSKSGKDSTEDRQALLGYEARAKLS